jgi:hypothetical protein
MILRLPDGRVVEDAVRDDRGLVVWSRDGERASRRLLMQTREGILERLAPIRDGEDAVSAARRRFNGFPTRASR